MGEDLLANDGWDAGEDQDPDAEKVAENH